MKKLLSFVILFQLTGILCFSQGPFRTNKIELIERDGEVMSLDVKGNGKVLGKEFPHDRTAKLTTLHTNVIHLTRYVSVGGNDEWDGESEFTPKRTLNSAIDSVNTIPAHSGSGTIAQIFLGPGMFDTGPIGLTVPLFRVRIIGSGTASEGTYGTILRFTDSSVSSNDMFKFLNNHAHSCEIRDLRIDMNNNGRDAMRVTGGGANFTLDNIHFANVNRWCVYSAERPVAMWINNVFSSSVGLSNPITMDAVTFVDTGTPGSFYIDNATLDGTLSAGSKFRIRSGDASGTQSFVPAGMSGGVDYWLYDAGAGVLRTSSTNPATSTTPVNPTSAGAGGIYIHKAYDPEIHGGFLYVNNTTNTSSQSTVRAENVQHDNSGFYPYFFAEKNLSTLSVNTFSGLETESGTAGLGPWTHDAVFGVRGKSGDGLTYLVVEGGWFHRAVANNEGRAVVRQLDAGPNTVILSGQGMVHRVNGYKSMFKTGDQVMNIPIGEYSFIGTRAPLLLSNYSGTGNVFEIHNGAQAQGKPSLPSLYSTGSGRLTSNGWLQLKENADSIPTTADHSTFYARDDGAGLTEVYAQLPSGQPSRVAGPPHAAQLSLEQGAEVVDIVAASEDWSNKVQLLVFNSAAEYSTKVDANTANDDIFVNRTTTYEITYDVTYEALNAEEIEFRVYVDNGTLPVIGSTRLGSASTAQQQGISGRCISLINAGSTVELWAQNLFDTGDFTVEHCNLTVKALD